MENHYFRIECTEDFQLEFYIVDTNELDPVVDLKEVGIVIHKEGQQIDADLNLNELKSLINYLEMSRDYIEKFNSNSKAGTPHVIENES
jgi:hypothetical protein